MRFVQVETLPEGRALVDVDKVTHAVPGTRLFLGAQHSAELENVLAGRERGDDGEHGGAGSTCADV